MKFLKQIELPTIVTIIFLLFIVYAIFVRAQGLGYSGFQGDEVNPMDFLYEMEDGVLPYLMSQKRGPIQYLINITNVGILGYHNETQIRLPFLIFGVLALFTLYKLSAKMFDKTTAFMAVVFMAVNGLFIAFARITQYQSFMYFLIPIGVYLFIKALDKKNSKGFLFSGLIMSLALLAHYDTLSVVPFFVVGFAGKFYRDAADQKVDTLKDHTPLIKKYIKYILIFFLTFLIPALIYYVPFYLGQAFESTTSGYLENRLLGGGFMPRTVITLKLLTMYIPRFHIYILFLLGMIGILFMGCKFDRLKFKKYIISKRTLKIVLTFLVVLLVAATLFSFYPIKPRSSSLLIIGSAIVISLMLTFTRKLKWTHASVATWFLGSYSFYFFIMKDPRTHVYVVFIPLFILAGYGFIKLYQAMKPMWLKAGYLTVTVLMLLYIAGVSWVIYVDKSPEYPWWDKDFLGNPIYRIQRVRHKKIEGVFGFNNYRAWDQVADLFDKGCLKGSFNSNEKDSITYFYIRQHQKQGSEWGLKKDAENIIIVEGPHSWEYEKGDDLPSKYKLIHTIYSEGVPVTFIYGSDAIYPEGKMLCEE